MEKTTEELTIENENLKQGNIKVWEQIEKSTEILSHHEAYISLLEEENSKLKELLRECLAHLTIGKYGTSVTPINILCDEVEEVLK